MVARNATTYSYKKTIRYGREGPRVVNNITAYKGIYVSPVFPFVGKLLHRLSSLLQSYTTDPYLRLLFPSQRALQLCNIALHYLYVTKKDAEKSRHKVT